MREDDTSEDRPNGAGIGQMVMSLPRKRNGHFKNKVGYSPSQNVGTLSRKNEKASQNLDIFLVHMNGPEK